MTKFVEDFKKFAMRGNVVDMTIGIVIGTAFGAIAKSLVSDLIMPPIGLVLGNVDFTDLFVVLKEGAKAGPYITLMQAREAGAVTFNYGAALNTVINFMVVAVAMFALIKAISRMELHKKPSDAPETKECPHCATAIPMRARRCPQCTSVLEG